MITSEIKSNYLEALDEIKINFEKQRSGKFNAIPFGFPRFDAVFPGIMQGVVYATTSFTGVGKSQITKNLFVQRPYDFIKQHPESGVSLKIFWFGLEESSKEFTLSMISNKLYQDTGLLIDTNDLLSRKKNKVLPDVVRNLLKSKEYQDYFNEFEKIVEIIDYEYGTYGIYKKIRDYAIANGTFYVNDIPVKSRIDNNKHVYVSEEGEVFTYFTHYKPHNPDEYVIIVIDHVSIIEQSKDEPTLHEAMSKLVSKYLRKIWAKKFNYIPVVIHQQTMDGDDENKFKGAKVTPALSKLAENKIIGREYMVVLGLFSPDRYQIPEYAGYDIAKLRDRYRHLSILKNRLGRSNVGTSLAFLGEVFQFYELPPSEDMDNNVYKSVIEGKFKS